MQKGKQLGHNGLGLFLVGEKGTWGKVGELFLPSDSSAHGPALLPAAPAKPRDSAQQNPPGERLILVETPAEA